VVLPDQSGKYQFAVLTEQTHAVLLETPRSSGTFQLLIARRTPGDSVVLNDKLPHSQKMWFLLGDSPTITRQRRSLLPRIMFPLHFSGALAVPSASQWTTDHRPYFAPLSAALPVNIALFSLTPLQNASDGSVAYILRLQHLYEIGEDATYSQPVTINLSQIFAQAPYILSTCVEKNFDCFN